MVVSQDEQCNLAIVNSDWQIGQLAGAGRIFLILQDLEFAYEFTGNIERIK
jgi:hypothetical protein